MPTIVCIPEWKEIQPQVNRVGLNLFTVHVRRSRPDTQDPMWNSHSKLNCIHACIQGSKAGADEALMLDPQGFVSTCNSTNFFIVRRLPRNVFSDISDDQFEVWAPTTKYQLHGITRQMVLNVCRHHGIPCVEKDFTLTEVYGATEAFVTGTFAGLIPVASVDGRPFPLEYPVTRRLQSLYKDLIEMEAKRGRTGLL
jgi:branched-chain amino acid aminotransferase